jgi:hypothetical protein
MVNGEQFIKLIKWQALLKNFVNQKIHHFEEHSVLKYHLT